MSFSASIAKTLIVEGWRFIPHSYAMVNQWQLLALIRRPDVTLKFADAPFYRERWQPQKGLFAPGEERALESIPIAETNERADVTLRISAPFDFSPSTSEQTAVFG